MPIYSDFKHHLHRQLQALSPTSPLMLLVGYSGGLDSQVLAHLCLRLYQEEQVPVRLIHVNHGLSQNADHWQEHCRQWACSHQLKLICNTVQLDRKPRESLEAIARSARYQVFRDHLQPGEILLTAHHRDDQAETFLLQLKRGAGVKGLSAMAPAQLLANGFHLRPLLEFSRAALESYAARHRLTWCEDESNQDTHFDRNYIRQQLMPELRQRWPGIEKTVARSASLCAEQQQLADEIAEMDAIQATDQVADQACLQLDVLCQLSPSRRNNLLRYWLARQGILLPSQSTLLQAWQQLQMAREDANLKIHWSDGHQTVELRRYQNRVFAFYRLPELSDISVPWNGEKDIKLTAAWKLGYQPDQSAFALRSPRSDEQVVIRFRQSGRCHIEGRAGSRTFKKLFQEFAVPPWQRAVTPLVYYRQADGSELLAGAAGVWVCKGFLAQQPGLTFRLLQSETSYK